jgi:hypothetical protein
MTREATQRQQKARPIYAEVTAAAGGEPREETVISFFPGDRRTIRQSSLSHGHTRGMYGPKNSDSYPSTA